MRNHYALQFKPRRQAGLSLLLSAIFMSQIGGLNAQVDEASKRAQVYEIYQKQIPLMEQYLERDPRGPQAATYLFRLGEAYFESAKYAQIQDQSSRSLLYSRKAIEALERLRREHPHYERLDEALLVLASTYLENAHHEQAGPVLADLADRFPNSDVVQKSAHLLGDYYAQQQRFAQAQHYYEKATHNESSSAYGYYRLAWTAMQQGQSGLALKNFEQVIRMSSQASGQSFDYSKDAARELIWPALEIYSSQKVVAYLEKLMPTTDLLKEALETLAAGSLKKGNYTLASQVYDDLHQRFAGDAQQASWLSQQLEAEEKLGRSDRIISLVSKLSGSQENSKELQSQVYSTAKKYHSEAQKEKDPKSKATKYDQAIAYYQAFLNLGSNLPKQDEVQFYLGEALYAREKYDQAASYYQAVAQNSQSAKQAEAAWNWYLTTEKTAPGFKYQGKSKVATTTADEAFLQAASFVTNFEKLPIDQRRKASYQAARLIYQLNDFDRAMPLFKQLAENYPSSQEGRLSAQLVLDIYNLQENYQAVAQYATKYQEGSTSVESQELEGLAIKAKIKSIQQDEEKARTIANDQERAKALVEIAKRYLAFAQQNRNSNLSDGALWASLQLFATASSKSGDDQARYLRAAIDVLEKDFPKSKHRQEAILLLGQYFIDHSTPQAVVQQYARYRDQWLTLVNKTDASKRGPVAMMIYSLSSEKQKLAMQEEFLKYPKTPENRLAIATAWYSKIEDLQERFAELKIDQEKKLQDQTKQKLKALGHLEEQIVLFVELGEPKFAVRSLELLAQAFANMATSIRQAPVPSILQGEDRNQYQQVVASKAAEYEQKAQNTQNLAKKKAQELGV